MRWIGLACHKENTHVTFITILYRNLINIILEIYNSFILAQVLRLFLKTIINTFFFLTNDHKYFNVLTCGDRFTTLVLFDEKPNTRLLFNKATFIIFIWYIITNKNKKSYLYLNTYKKVNRLLFLFLSDQQWFLHY